MVMTNGKFSPAGKGSGNRSGATSAMPTLPPREPCSLKSVFGGTDTVTPTRDGFAASTEGANVITVVFVALTGLSASA